MIDLLDWLDYAAYDAGPGQLMLRESDFYAAHERGSQPEKLDVSAKVEKLFACFEEGIRSLFNNRKKRLARQRGLFKTFTNAGNYSIDQSQMRFAP
ncbi:MAG: hypothetical protein JW959_03345 [Pirellulales bacterium]|nr:hypothetical protein [Pirellulales bacterium]